MEKSLEVQGIRVTRQKFAIVASRLVCLNFKVPMQVRQHFKIYAAQHDMTMTEILLQLLIAVRIPMTTEGVPHSQMPK